jgi:hypothetical protein
MIVVSEGSGVATLPSVSFSRGWRRMPLKRFASISKRDDVCKSFTLLSRNDVVRASIVERLSRLLVELAELLAELDGMSVAWTVVGEVVAAII